MTSIWGSLTLRIVPWQPLAATYVYKDMFLALPVPRWNVFITTNLGLQRLTHSTLSWVFWYLLWAQFSNWFSDLSSFTLLKPRDAYQNYIRTPVPSIVQVISELRQLEVDGKETQVLGCGALALLLGCGYCWPHTWFYRGWSWVVGQRPCFAREPDLQLRRAVLIS